MKQFMRFLKQSTQFKCVMIFLVLLVFVFCSQSFCLLNAEENKPIVIFLNGTSSAGKSSVATKLLERLDGPFLRVGLDWYGDVLSPKFQCGGEHADQGYTFVHTEDEIGPLTSIKTGAVGLQLDSAAHRAMKVFLDSGFSLVIDEVLFEDASFKDYLTVLKEYCVYFIAIKPTKEVVAQREMNRGNRVLGFARGLYDAVYSNKIYDLEIDSSELTTEETVEIILEYVKKNPSPMAFKSN
jgi:chloramphenicol 3-O phosphotransferase